MVRLGGLLKSGSSLFKSAGKGGLGNLGSGFANKIKFRPTKPKLKIKKQPKIKTTKPKTPDTKKAKELKKTPVDKVKQADNLKAAKKTGPLNKMKTMSKNGLRKARTACRKNPVKCGGALALAGYAASTYFKNTEEQRKCIMQCIPVNWNEYIDNMCIGLYWEGADSPPPGGTDVSAEILVTNIRNHAYRRGAPDDEPYVDITTFSGTKSDILVDLTEDQNASDFGNIPFDTSYVMVDGICFVPSVRYQDKVDKQPFCAEKSRDELISRASVYRCGEDPCDSCKSECESKHPTTPMGVVSEAAGNLAKDVVGLGLNIAGLDPAVLSYIGYGIGVFVCLFAKKMLNSVFGNGKVTFILWLVVVMTVVEYFLGQSLWCQFMPGTHPPWANNCRTTIAPLSDFVKKNIMKKPKDEDDPDHPKNSPSCKATQ
ncbi:MAG: hypothetical protein CBC65_001765 [Rhodothermaceae bacterium TMED105]|nr:MAG: hypothetical protein CBC65_001765 [Rhodothermaceae bacterium TMED105]